MSRLSISEMARGLPLWLAVGMCVSVAALTWFGYQAITEWRRSLSLLSVRRAGITADLFVKALTRDMEAVQTTVLVSPNWDNYVLDSPYNYVLSWPARLRAIRTQNRSLPRPVESTPVSCSSLEPTDRLDGWRFRAHRAASL